MTSSKCCFTPSYYRFINVAMELLRGQKVQNCSFYQYQMYIITARNSSCGKVMFSEACVSHSVPRGLGYLWSHVLFRGIPHSQSTPIPETTKAGGTHPTGILSCWNYEISYEVDKCATLEMNPKYPDLKIQGWNHPRYKTGDKNGCALFSNEDCYGCQKYI